MKRLIDANALTEVIDELVNASLFQGAELCVGDIRSIIATQPTIVCVSDDLTLCPKEIRCEDIMCGGMCGGADNG